MGKTKHSGPIKLDTSWQPSMWASLMPMGLGKIMPHQIRDTMKVMYDDRDNLGYAYRILTQGVHLPFAEQDGAETDARDRGLQLQLPGLDRHGRPRVLGIGPGH